MDSSEKENCNLETNWQKTSKNLDLHKECLASNWTPQDYYTQITFLKSGRATTYTDIIKNIWMCIRLLFRKATVDKKNTPYLESLHREKLISNYEKVILVKDKGRSQ